MEQLRAVEPEAAGMLVETVEPVVAGTPVETAEPVAAGRPAAVLAIADWLGAIHQRPLAG